MERTLEKALAHAEAVKASGDNHCLICDDPKSDSERNHAEQYQRQLNADAYCVLLADEVKRLSKLVVS